MAEPVLRVRGLAKRFGAVPACDGVDLELHAGEIHALIGPNGAGKTTLIAQLAGEIRPDAGSIRLHGHDITGSSVAARARLGLGRSFQVSSLFADMSVLDNARLALLGAERHCFRFWRPAAADHGLRKASLALLDQVGLAAHAEQPVATLAHGERRQLEYALAMAAAPAVLLLDEPMAGMGPDESIRMVDLLAAHRSRHATLLVEHDMDAVFALADRVTVLVYGQVVASGDPQQVRADPDVRRAYLGGGA